MLSSLCIQLHSNVATWLSHRLIRLKLSRFLESTFSIFLISDRFFFVTSRQLQTCNCDKFSCQLKNRKKLSNSPLLILWCRIILVYLMKAFITNNFLVYLTLPTHPLIHLHIYQSYIWAGLFHRTVTWRHRRRIKTEEKAKVVACCLGDVLYLNAAQTI